MKNRMFTPTMDPYDPDTWEKDGAYRLGQLDSGHWQAITPTDKESPIHWSKTEIRKWIKRHRRDGDRGVFV